MNGLSEAERRAGLDRPLPAGERILWQGAPSARALGPVVFRFRLVAVYLVLLVALATAMMRDGGWPMGPALALGLLAIPLGLIGLGILWLLGAMMARTACYTLTNRRVILHIGVALDRTISIPLSAITDASIRPRSKIGLGDIAFTVKDTGGLNYLNLWPHARAFHFMPPRPSLRSLPDAPAACEAIGEALVAFNTAPRAIAPHVATPEREPLRELAEAQA
ncbi:photosynthetic complex putative assembly protein PuhB [Aurantiacibacter spongiae]|uniref:PH domain-containing protein n=1 Tax=Aurantiacibacter spongiae TaxID=2488860 RepID=A0A3N5CTX5_9SPHN|nr:photosynthetic complex putative assembly protein PuhB [Aurantiacibacter spongiae]RPF71766.1 PH domain-containing protein [Aurantiacibacter spongiae]